MVYICSQAQRFLLAYMFETKNTYNERCILDNVPRLLIHDRIVEIHHSRLKKDGFLITVEFWKCNSSFYFLEISVLHPTVKSVSFIKPTVLPENHAWTDGVTASGKRSLNAKKQWFLTPNRSVLSLFRLFLLFHLSYIIKKRRYNSAFAPLNTREKQNQRHKITTRKEKFVFIYCRMQTPSHGIRRFRETLTWKQNHQIINVSIKLGPQKCRQIETANTVCAEGKDHVWVFRSADASGWARTFTGKIRKDWKAERCHDVAGKHRREYFLWLRIKIEVALRQWETGLVVSQTSQAPN